MDKQRQRELEQKLKNLQLSEYGMVLKEWLKQEYDIAKEHIIDDPNERNAGKAQQLRNIIKLLF